MDDFISRQAAIDAINHICPVDTEYDCTLLDRVDVRCVLSDLPSVQPERMRGKWVNYGEGECCDQCGRYPYDDGEFHILGWRSNFCPNCGADMREDIDHGTD